MADLEARIQKLEERAAFQDDALQKLDDAMANQQRQLLDLQRRVRLLAEQLRKVEQLLPPEASELDPPPHY